MVTKLRKKIAPPDKVANDLDCLPRRGLSSPVTALSCFSIFKRGMKGVYQHCQKKHLHRYQAEFDFRYSNREANGFDDTARADELLKGVVGKRLTYQQTH